MSAYQDTPLFDPVPGRDYTPGGTRDDRIPTHAHTGEGCVFCATRTGQGAKLAGTEAVNRDHAWRDEAERWLRLQVPGDVFTADDLVGCIGKPVGSGNQIGALLRGWATAGRIHMTGVANAGRAQSHGRLIRVWQVAA
jgi:hypothetical protein